MQQNYMVLSKTGIRHIIIISIFWGGVRVFGTTNPLGPEKGKSNRFEVARPEKN